MPAVVLRRTPTIADVMAAAVRLRAAKEELRELVAVADGPVLGEALIQIREAGIDPLEAVFADGLRRFDAAGEYAEDGSLRTVDWLRWKCKMSAGAAGERLTVARQIEHLPRTEDAFARGEVSYQQVAVLARTADHVGADQLRKVDQGRGDDGSRAAGRDRQGLRAPRRSPGRARRGQPRLRATLSAYRRAGRRTGSARRIARERGRGGPAAGRRRTGRAAQGR